MSVVGAYYYLRVIKLMYFDSPAQALPPTARNRGVRFALGLNALGDGLAQANAFERDSSLGGNRSQQVLVFAGIWFFR